MHSATLTISKTLDLGILGERECKITLQYFPGRPGSFYRRNGDPGDPPDPAEANLLLVMCEGWPITDLCYHFEEQDWFMEAAGEAYGEHMTPEEA